MAIAIEAFHAFAVVDHLGHRDPTQSFGKTSAEILPKEMSTPSSALNLKD